jgi:hypothetical protein
MLISCWSTKGGTGTTVVAAGLALLLARSTGAALAADLAGDLPLVLGLPVDGAAGRPGLAEWSAAAPEVAADALGRLEEPVTGSLGLLRRGAGALAAGGAPLLAGMLAADPRPVVVDCGRLDAGDGTSTAIAAAADRSLLVLRPCFLALRRAVDAPIRATGIVLLTDEGRALGAADVEATLGLPVLARVRVTDAVARAVDAGLLAARVPRTLTEDLRHAA